MRRWARGGGYRKIGTLSPSCKRWPGGQAVVMNAGLVKSGGLSDGDRFAFALHYPKTAAVRTSASAGQLKYSTIMCRSNGEAGLPFRAASMTRRQTSTVA